MTVQIKPLKDHSEDREIPCYRAYIRDGGDRWWARRIILDLVQVETWKQSGEIEEAGKEDHVLDREEQGFHKAGWD